MSLTVAELAERIGAELVGDGSVKVNAVGPVDAAGESDVTFSKTAGIFPNLKIRVRRLLLSPSVSKIGLGHS